MNKETKYTIIDTCHDRESQTLTVKEILDEIVNNDRSDEWTHYDDHDWFDGLLEMTQHNIIFKKGQEFYWNDPDDGICSGEVVLEKDIEVASMSDVVITNKGEIPLHELHIPSEE